MLTVREIAQIIDDWAPREIAWERDNAGLQVGDPQGAVQAILVCLDVDESIVREAARKRANLVVSHHPLIFRPLRDLNTRSAPGKVVTRLLGSGISLYSAHTSLDFTRGGTSFALGQALKLRDIDFLARTYMVDRKIATYVPAERADAVANAMAGAGAGVIGNYDHCSFRSEGTGTFRGNELAHPAMGAQGTLENVPEVRLEMVAQKWNIGSVVSALKQSHPYEEVAYDIYPIENRSGNYGMGVIGTLPSPMPLMTLLRRVKRALGAGALRYSGDPRHVVQRVAVCGGSGSELLEEAVTQGADVFITADVKYHTFQDAIGRIVLVDAGHYETEGPIVPVVVEYLKREIRKRGKKIPVLAARSSKNPISYV